MNIQLLIIIAVMISSSLMIFQRVNAQEVGQFRWLEPTAEELIDDTISSDTDLDNNYIVSTLFFRKVLFPFNSTNLYRYNFSIVKKINRSLNPRAPPADLI